VEATSLEAGYGARHHPIGNEGPRGSGFQPRYHRGKIPLPQKSSTSLEGNDMRDRFYPSAFSLQPKHLIWLTVVNSKQNFLSPFFGVFSEYEFKA
jgi:hypothetical protein